VEANLVTRKRKIYLLERERRYAIEMLTSRTKFGAAIRAGYSPAMAKIAKAKIERPAVLAEIERLRRENGGLVVTCPKCQHAIELKTATAAATEAVS
jgi:phage terminase small subunit